jgi:Protein of unknown function (DUF4239)
MFGWAYDIPNWQVAAIFSGVSVAIMWGGIIFIKPIIGLFFSRQDDINSVVGNSVSAFSVFYGLLLGLISVATYQTYSSLSDNVSREASSIAALFRDFSAYDSPAREELQEATRRYVRTTIDVDWPTQRQGILPTAGSSNVTELFGRLTRYEPPRLSQQLLHAEALREFSSFVEARRTRLANITTGIPGVLWYVVLMGGALNILLFWMFDMRFMVHITLGGIIAFFLGVMIYIIVAMDVPYRGAVSVSSGPFEEVYVSMMKPTMDKSKDQRK